jgi:ATPase family associated with various cellular activities (AAA)
MLETIMKLYVMAMAGDVRSPMPHLFGPPGCGKSSVVQELADLVGKRLHIINVSRISPLELEGVQMPMTEEDEQKLKLLIATFWSTLEDGDIVLLDEFLRGFPEVYNGLLDILTSRQVGWFKLPKVFIIGASNSTVSYDKALEDRLLHLPAPDPRKNKRVKKDLAQRVVDSLGLLPEMVDSYEMQTMLDTEVLPMYEILDSLKNKSASPALLKGCSIRNLIGQARLREVQSTSMRELLAVNNQRAIAVGKIQYVFLTTGKKADQSYFNKAQRLQGNSRLTETQALNLDLNLQLIELEKIRFEKEGSDDDDAVEFVDDAPPF